MQAHPHYTTPLDAPDPCPGSRPAPGRGISVAHRFNSGQMSSAAIHVNSNGTINLITGSVDLSGSRVSIAMQAAEALGLRAEDVNPMVVDTDASRSTPGSGGAGSPTIPAWRPSRPPRTSSGR